MGGNVEFSGYFWIFLFDEQGKHFRLGFWNLPGGGWWRGVVGFFFSSAIVFSRIIWESHPTHATLSFSSAVGGPRLCSLFTTSPGCSSLLETGELVSPRTEPPPPPLCIHRASWLCIRAGIRKLRLHLTREKKGAIYTEFYDGVGILWFSRGVTIIFWFWNMISG